MYKLIALDLDGTLTNSQKEITARTLDTLLRAQEHGLKIILASGRPLQGIYHLAEQLKLKKYGGYILAFNGGLITSCQTNEIIYRKFLDPDIYPIIYKYGNTDEFRILSYLGDCIASEDIENHYVKKDARLNNMQLYKTDNFLETINFPEPKCLIVGNPEKLQILEKKMCQLFQGKCSVYRSEPYFLEIVPLGIDKAECLRTLLDHLGYSTEELIACGDGFNDRSMIQFAGLGIAMANAQQEVKDVANFITLSNDEDGVAYAVEKFYLER